MSGESTFSVEVLSFASGVEDQGLVRSIAKTFGIPETDAQGMVGRVPVRVKRGADGATAKKLVGQLLALKADVKIINEQSGDEKLYKAGAATSIPPPAADAPATSIQPGVASQKPQTAAGPDIPGTIRANAGASLLEALQSAKDRRSGRAPASRKPSQPSKPLSQPPPSGSTPPPAGEGGVVIEDCKVCMKKVTAGDICNHCGWSNSQRKRLSPEGKEPEIGSSLGAGVSIALLVAALGAGGAAFMLVGPFVGPAVALCILGLSFLLNGLKTTLRTEKFTVPASSLKKEETAQIGKARRKFIGIAVVAILVGGGVGSLHFAGSTAMRIDSLGIAWESNIGRGATSTGRSAKISTMHGSHNVAILSATTDGVEYGLMRATLPYDKHESFDDELTEEVLKKCVTVALDDASLGDLTTVTHDDVEGRAAPISGTMNGKPVFGQVQIFRYEHEYVLIYVAAPTEKQATDATAKSYMASLKTVNKIDE